MLKASLRSPKEGMHDVPFVFMKKEVLYTSLLLLGMAAALFMLELSLIHI